MDNDDLPIGKILSRREALSLLGIAGAAFSAAAIAGCAPGATATPAALNTEAQTAVAVGSNPTAVASAQAQVATVAAANATAMPSCVVRPEVTEGPYYVNEDLNRSDIRTDSATGTAKPGAPLVLTFNVTQVGTNGCTPLPNAKVEIWHCDAAGTYSDVTDRGFTTKGHDYLRGYQMTDANGLAKFTTIYPGWYSGRAVHIHFKVHPSANQVFTSQIFFDDTFTDQVFTAEPYASKGARNVRNSNDGIYQPLLLTTAAKTADGYAANFDIGMQMS